MGWQWHQLNHMQAICTSLQKITTSAPHYSGFYGPDALPAAQPTALKATVCKNSTLIIQKQSLGGIGHAVITEEHEVITSVM